MRRGVGITGLGTVTGLGLGARVLWDGLCVGRSCLGPISAFDASGFPGRLGGEVADLPIRDRVPKKERKSTKVMARDTQLAVAAAWEAAQHAGLRTAGVPEDAAGFEIDPTRLGCQIGAGLLACEIEEMARAQATSLDDNGVFSMRAWGAAEGVEGARGAIRNLPPLWMLKYLPNMLACHVTILHGARGPSNTITTSESSGLLSLGESARIVERGGADVCFSGGAESKLNPLGLLRLHYAGRLGDTGDETDGSRLVRPYDPASVCIPGEVGAIMMVEGVDHARARGAEVLAYVLGFGSSLAPAPDDALYGEAPEVNEGIVFAARAAMRDAGVGPEEIDAVVPAAIGAPAIDRAEAGALREIFGERLERIPLVTMTPSVGFGVAGHSALQAAVGVMCIERGGLPGRVHAGRPADGLRAGASEPETGPVRRVLVVTGSAGGPCAAMVLGRPSEKEKETDAEG